MQRFLLGLCLTFMFRALHTLPDTPYTRPTELAVPGLLYGSA